MERIGFLKPQHRWQDKEALKTKHLEQPKQRNRNLSGKLSAKPARLGFLVIMERSRGVFI